MSDHPAGCQCAAIANGPEELACWNCGRVMFVDASRYPVFDTRAQQMEHCRVPALDTVAIDWIPRGGFSEEAWARIRTAELESLRQFAFAFEAAA